jgi:hypothetical protein
MNRDDFERLQRRFGKDWTTWPPPYRQEARAFLEAADADDDLDSLLLAAIDVPGDEGALARTVLSRIEGRAAWPAFSAASCGLSRLPCWRPALPSSSSRPLPSATGSATAIRA